MADITQNTNDIPELQSPFEQLREVDGDGREWWNSRKLARVMGYGKYWNFERVIAKAQAWASRKGYHRGEQFGGCTGMAVRGSGAVREVSSFRLSRAACMVCTRCGSVVDVPLPLGDTDLDGRAADATGWMVLDHAVLFRGVCPACLKLEHDNMAS